MTREIDAVIAGIAKNPGKGPEVRAEREQAPRAQDRNTVPTRSDTVSLTEAGTRVKELQDRVAAVPVVNAQRVQEIKQALASGTHAIDPARIADKLVRFESVRGSKP
ncbi:MAG: flagellar biosynthesis anti-sigma factor FlgM [Gammaproteobacteria bacterium]|nr:flagellar biosynthesis anti-sigma factor FlgM [Gammaproteobacteria bacterium]